MGAIYSASGYVGAFSRASNVIWEVEEGRPFWKLKPWQILITTAMLMMLSACALAVFVTGPIAEDGGQRDRRRRRAPCVWEIAKWPVIALVVAMLFAFLYWSAPNVEQPKFRWITPGGILAVVLWLAASGLFAFYVATFSSYNATYGALAGVIVFLVWLWITNIAMLLGAELNAEVERGRELEAGIPIEDTIALPPREPARTTRTTSPARKTSRRGAERYFGAQVRVDAVVRIGDLLGDASPLLAKRRGVDPVAALDLGSDHVQEVAELAERRGQLFVAGLGLGGNVDLAQLFDRGVRLLLSVGERFNDLAVGARRSGGERVRRLQRGPLDLVHRVDVVVLGLRRATAGHGDDPNEPDQDEVADLHGAPRFDSAGPRHPKRRSYLSAPSGITWLTSRGSAPWRWTAIAGGSSPIRSCPSRRRSSSTCWWTDGQMKTGHARRSARSPRGGCGR